MLDLLGNPNCWFSHVKAQISYFSKKSVFTIFALSTGYQLTEINIANTGNQNPPCIDFSFRGVLVYWLPVFPVLIMFKLGTSR